MYQRLDIVELTSVASFIAYDLTPAGTVTAARTAGSAITRPIRRAVYFIVENKEHDVEVCRLDGGVDAAEMWLVLDENSMQET